MKTRENKKMKRITRAKAMIMGHIQMNRFIREIEREDPIDNETLRTMLVLQPPIVR